MARTARNQKIDTRSARARLPETGAIYWTIVAPGCSVGYRKGRTGGVWIAKFVGSGLRTQTTLGRADDNVDADGVLALSYYEAQERARQWFADIARRGAGDVAPRAEYTVEKCAEDYLAEQKRRGSKSIVDTVSRINTHIVPRLGDKLVSALTAKMIRDWLHTLAAEPKRLRSKRGAPTRHQAPKDDPEAVRRRKATANRTLSILKAALNHAFKDGRVSSDAEWRRVRPFREVEAARIRYLEAVECSRLTTAASDELRPLIQAALATGCRYSELASLTVADFDANAGTLRIRTSKAGQPRHVVLRSDGIELFRHLTKDRAPDDLILSRPGGMKWGRSHQIRPLAEAAQKADLAQPVTFHTLRHTYASHLAMAGVPLMVIAQNLGHADTRMTEKHYAHLAKTYVAQELRRAQLGFSVITNHSVIRKNETVPSHDG